MKPGKTFYTADRKAWRAWLAAHYGKEKEIWLVFPKKASGRPRLPYNDAVEEALSFGWIDSIAKRIDEETFAQRFSPRNPKSAYSEANKMRLRKLAKEGKVIPPVLAALKGVLGEKFTIAPDILEAIRSNRQAWKHFRKFSPGYKRIRVAFIEGARKRPGEFKKRLAYFIKMTERNKQFGFGGIEKYY